MKRLLIAILEIVIIAVLILPVLLWMAVGAVVIVIDGIREAVEKTTRL